MKKLDIKFKTKDDTIVNIIGNKIKFKKDTLIEIPFSEINDLEIDNNILSVNGYKLDYPKRKIIYMNEFYKQIKGKNSEWFHLRMSKQNKIMGFLYLAIGGIWLLITPIIGVILLLVGLFFIMKSFKKYDGSVTNPTYKETNPTIINNEVGGNNITDKIIIPYSDTPKYEKYYTYVAGVMHENNQGLEIQKILRDYISENYDTNDFADWTNKELIEFGYDIWEYDLTEIDTVSFELDPSNKYDNTAINVIHEEMGHIGYIPKKDKKGFNEFMGEYPNCKIQIDFKGGRYKHVDYDYESDKDKVYTETKPYYVDIELIGDKIV